MQEAKRHTHPLKTFADSLNFQQSCVTSSGIWHSAGTRFTSILVGGEQALFYPNPKLRVRCCLAEDSDDELITALRNAKGDEVERDWYYTRHKHCKIGGPQRSDYSVALLRTCRQIYDEAKHLPLESNTFSFHNYYDYDAFCQILDITRVGQQTGWRDALASLVLAGSVPAAGFLTTSKNGFKNLKHVKIFGSSSLDLGDLAFALWMATDVGLEYDDPNSYEDVQEFMDELHSFEHVSPIQLYDTFAMCLHYDPGSHDEAFRKGWPYQPLRTSLRAVCRQYERMLTK